MKRIYLFVLLLATISVTCTAQTVIPATDPHIHYEGRTWTDKGAVVLSWPGNSVTIRFKGTNISYKMHDEGENYYDEILDGRVIRIERPDGDTAVSVLQGLRPGIHTLELFKRTEWAMGKTWFYGFTLDSGTVVLPAL